MLNKILFFFIAVILCLQTQVMGGECTKDEILTMLKEGLSKQQIEIICKETLIEKDPMCCCEVIGYNKEITEGSPSPNGPPRYVKESYVEKDKKYKWIKSSECLIESSGYEKVVSRCVEAQHCGY